MDKIQHGITLPLTNKGAHWPAETGGSSASLEVIPFKQTP